MSSSQGSLAWIFKFAPMKLSQLLHLDSEFCLSLGWLALPVISIFTAKGMIYHSITFVSLASLGFCRGDFDDVLKLQINFNTCFKFGVVIWYWWLIPNLYLISSGTFLYCAWRNLLYSVSSTGLSFSLNIRLLKFVLPSSSLGGSSPCMLQYNLENLFRSGYSFLFQIIIANCVLSSGEI